MGEGRWGEVERGVDASFHSVRDERKSKILRVPESPKQLYLWLHLCSPEGKEGKTNVCDCCFRILSSDDDFNQGFGILYCGLYERRKRLVRLCIPYLQFIPNVQPDSSHARGIDAMPCYGFPCLPQCCRSKI